MSDLRIGQLLKFMVFAEVLLISFGAGIVQGTTPSKPYPRLTPSQAGRIAMDSAYAELQEQDVQLHGLQMKYSGVMMALEPTDENDYYVYQFKFDVLEDSIEYGVVFVNCNGGNTLRINRPTNHVQLGFAHSFHAYAEDVWINEILDRQREGSKLDYWGLVRATSKTNGVCTTTSAGLEQNRISLNDQMVWIPPTLMVRDQNGKYYILNRHGQICDLSDLDSRVFRRFDYIYGHKKGD